MICSNFVKFGELSPKDALHLWRVSDLELGEVIHSLTAVGLRGQAFDITQCLTQGFLHDIAELGHLASHFALFVSNHPNRRFEKLRLIYLFAIRGHPGWLRRTKKRAAILNASTNGCWVFDDYVCLCRRILNRLR